MSLQVTPCVGVWIEIETISYKQLVVFVTPCVGVWIEIALGENGQQYPKVTPCVGVWIEIGGIGENTADGYSHSLCGSVD